MAPSAPGTRRPGRTPAIDLARPSDRGRLRSGRPGCAEPAAAATTWHVAESEGETFRSRRSPAARRTRAPMAGDSHGRARWGDCGVGRAPVRTPGAAGAAERSVLVPGSRVRHGHGLALVRHHYVGHECPQE